MGNASTTQLFKWKIYCTIDNKYEYIWQTNIPTVCPINIEHTVNTNKISKESSTLAISITNIDSPYNMHLSSILADTTNGDITINLSKASRCKNGMVFIQKSATVNTVTVNADGADLIDGLSSITLTDFAETVILLSNGARWLAQDNRANVDDMYNARHLGLSNVKGDILVDNGLEISSEAIGTNNYLLMPDSSTTTGIKWSNDLIDNVINFVDNGDITKKMQFDLSNITTSTTRTVTVPNADITLVGHNTPQIITNKTINALNNTITNLSSSDIGLNNVQNIKIKLDATIGPTVNNDASEGYVVGSNWYDITADKAYTCLNNTTSSAIWTEITNAGSGTDDIIGPRTYTDNAIARFNGIGGKTIQNSGIIINDTDHMSGVTSLTVDPGLATAPSITFTGDTNTGLYRSAADELSITTNGTQRIIINSSGEVGIGGSAQSNYRMAIHNLSGKNGFCVHAGERLGDIAFHISDNDDTFQIMEMEADQGYITCGKTYAQTLADNDVVYGLDIQHAGSAKDFNTQSGIYRIGGKETIMGTEFQDASSDGESSTTSTTFQQKLRMTTGSLPNGKYRIGWSIAFKNNGGSGGEYIVQLNDTTTICNSNGYDSSTPGFSTKGGFYYASSISGVQNIDIDYRAINGTSYIKEARLEIWRIS